MTPHPTKSQAAQILAQRHAAIRWSTNDARAAWKQEAAAQIASLAEAKATGYHDFIDGLTPEQIAQMERMTQETATEPPMYDGMWK